MEDGQEKKQCAGWRKDGQRCGGSVLEGGEWCMTHINYARQLGWEKGLPHEVERALVEVAEARQARAEAVAAETRLRDQAIAVGYSERRLRDMQLGLEKQQRELEKQQRELEDAGKMEGSWLRATYREMLEKARERAIGGQDPTGLLQVAQEIRLHAGSKMAEPPARKKPSAKGSPRDWIDDNDLEN